MRKLHLGHKHEAECEGCAEYYEHRDEHEGGVSLLLEDGRDGHAQHAHDHHVIEAHAHILSTGANMAQQQQPGLNTRQDYSY